MFRCPCHVLPSYLSCPALYCFSESAMRLEYIIIIFVAIFIKKAL